MVHHRINRRNIEMMVKEDENLPQQIAHQPGQDERQHHLSPRDARRRTVEAEEERIQGKENQQRNKSKNTSLATSAIRHSGEKIVLPGMVEQGYQFREMGQERHHHGNDDDCQYIFIYIYFHTANILISFLHAPSHTCQDENVRGFLSPVHKFRGSGLRHRPPGRQTAVWHRTSAFPCRSRGTGCGCPE